MAGGPGVESWAADLQRDGAVSFYVHRSVGDGQASPDGRRRASPAQLGEERTMNTMKHGVGRVSLNWRVDGMAALISGVNKCLTRN